MADKNRERYANQSSISNMGLLSRMLHRNEYLNRRQTEIELLTTAKERKKENQPRRKTLYATVITEQKNSQKKKKKSIAFFRQIFTRELKDSEATLHCFGDI